MGRVYDVRINDGIWKTGKLGKQKSNGVFNALRLRITPTSLSSRPTEQLHVRLVSSHTNELANDHCVVVILLDPEQR